MSRSVGLLARDTDLRTFGNTEAAYALRAGSRMPAPNPVASHLPAPERELAGRASLLSRLRELLSEGGGRAARHRASGDCLALDTLLSRVHYNPPRPARQRPSIGGRRMHVSCSNTGPHVNADLDCTPSPTGIAHS